MAKKRTKANGEGSITYNEKTKTYRGFMFTNEIDEKGKRRRASFSSKKKKDVVAWMTDIKSQLDNNTYIEKSEILLIDLVYQYIDNLYNANKIMPATYKRKKDTAKIVATLKIADMPIQDITINDINNDLIKIKDYSNSVIQKITGLISTTFNYAIIHNIVNKNPFAIRGAIIKPQSSKMDRKVEAFTIEEQQQFLDTLKNSQDEYKDIMLVALYTGMRIGEILALKGTDIDFDNNIIKVSRTLTKTENDKIIIGETTKTYSGLREVPILDVLIPILKNYSNKDIIFLKNEKLISPATINSHFKKVCKDADIMVKTVKKRKGKRRRKICKFKD